MMPETEKVLQNIANQKPLNQAMIDDPHPVTDVDHSCNEKILETMIDICKELIQLNKCTDKYLIITSIVLIVQSVCIVLLIAWR